MTSGPTTQQIVATCVQSYCLGPSASPQNIATAQQPQDITREEYDRTAVVVATPNNNNYFITTPFYSLTDGNETIACVGGSIASTANTTEYWSIFGRPTPSTTENDVKFTIRKSGILSKFAINFGGNSISGITTLTLRKNGADTNMTLTIIASGAQIVEDLVNSITVSPGDTIDVESVPGASTGTFTIDTISLNFVADDGKSCQLMGSSRSSSISSASATRFIPLNGDNTNDTTEAEAKVRQKKSGFYQYLYVNVTANARTTNTVFRSRKNGANGNISVTYAAGETGPKEDIINVDTVAVDDDYNFGLSTGTGTETLTYTIVAISFFADDQSGFFETGNLNTNTLAANLTRYMIVGASTNFFSTEQDTKRRVRVSRMTVTGIQCYLVQNTVTANSTLTLRKNGANATNAITITASTTGFFQDNAHQDEFNAGDDMNLQIVTGATGTQIEISQVTIFYKTPRVTSESILKWNMLQRVSPPTIAFDGVDDRINCGNHATLWSQGLTKFSFFIRIYPTAGWDGQFRAIVVHGSGTAHGFECYIESPTVGDTRWFIRDSGGNLKQAQSTDLVLNKWNDVFGTYDSTLGSANIKIFIGNVQGGTTGDLTETINQSATLFISNNANDLKGNAKDFRFWTTIALDSTQRTNVINNSPSAPTPDYWLQMNENSGTPVDYIGGKTTTFENGPTWSTRPCPAWSGAESTLKWNTLARVSLERIIKWNTLARISLERILKWNTTIRVSLERILKWNTLGRVSLESILKWNTLGRTSAEFILKWNTLKRVSKELILLWNTLARVSKESILKWNTLARVSLERILKWNTLSRVSKESILLWNTLSRVSKELTLLWNILADSTSRVSAEFILKWNTLGRVSLESILKWNTLSRVSKELILLWNTLARVSKESILLWNSLGRISKEVILKWNLTIRVSLERILKWNTTARVSLESILKWNTLERVSKEVILQWIIRNLTEPKAVFTDIKGKFGAHMKIPKIGSFMRSLYNRNQDDI